MERTAIQERIEKIVSNGSLCASPFLIESSNLSNLYGRRYGGLDLDEDLQRALCLMNMATSESDEKRKFFYGKWLEMATNLYGDIIKLVKPLLSK